jgi:hypothetical protein
VATCHGRAFGPGGEPSSARSAPSSREKVECPLLPVAGSVWGQSAFRR